MKVILVVISLCIFSIVSLPSANAECSGYSCIDAIKEITVTSSVVLIDTDGIETNLDSSLCVPQSDKYIRFLKSHPSYDEIYSILLMAQFAGKPVQIRVTNDDDSIDSVTNKPRCKVSYIRNPT